MRDSCGLEISVWPAHILLLSTCLGGISFWMKFLLSSQTLHPCVLGFVMARHWLKIRFEHNHNSSLDCKCPSFNLFVAKLNGGGATLYPTEVSRYLTYISCCTLGLSIRLYCSVFDR